MDAPAMSAAELDHYLRREFPQVFRDGSGLSIEET